jgi:xylan 1,4-beta-xylosidase
LSFPLREGHTGELFTDPRFILPAQGEVYLRAKVNHHVLHFDWSMDGQKWQTLPYQFDYSVISDEAGKGEGASFTGAFVGMACHDTSGQNCAADFDFFEYVEGP